MTGWLEMEHITSMKTQSSILMIKMHKKMKYPAQIQFSKTLTCKVTFPDYPNIQVEGVNRELTITKARNLLIKTLMSRLSVQGPVPMPSACRLGQQLVKIPEDLAVRIITRNSIYQADISARGGFMMGEHE